MPRALKPCSVSRCPELVTAGRCQAHRKAADRQRGTAQERGYDARWRKTRAAHLRRSPFCVEPGCYLAASEVDHIDGEGPKGPRGHDHDNLRSLCKPHHSQRTARDQPGGWNQR